MKYITCFTLLLSFVLFMSCGDDGLIDDCSDTVALNSVIADETDNLTDALTAFSTDQSSSNCSDLKNAYEDYIDALQSLQGCANDAGVGDEFRNSINEAEDGLGDIGC